MIYVLFVTEKYFLKKKTVPTTILPVMIAEEKEKYTLRSLMLAKFAVLVPTTSFQTIFLSALDGKPVFSGENPLAFAICLVWIAAGYAVFHIFYKKRGMDY